MLVSLGGGNCYTGQWRRMVVSFGGWIWGGDAGTQFQLFQGAKTNCSRTISQIFGKKLTVFTTFKSGDIFLGDSIVFATKTL